MIPAGTTACASSTSPCADAAPVTVAVHDIGVHCHSRPPGRPAFSSSACCACASFPPFPAQAATCLSSPAAAASASTFHVDAAADHSREAACHVSFALAVRGNPSSFEPSLDLDSADCSSCTPAAASDGRCTVAAGTAAPRCHRATQCGVLSSCCTHFAAAANRSMQQLAFCELMTSPGPSLTAAVGAWEAPDAQISNTRAGEGLGLAGDDEVSARSSAASLSNFTAAAAPPKKKQAATKVLVVARE
jgi:hypothetical protein